MTSKGLSGKRKKNMVPVNTPCGVKFAGKVLSVLAMELIATGKLSEQNASSLIDVLAEDLKIYPEGWVEKAIQGHRKTSPFWPSLSDMMKFIVPLENARRSKRARSKQDQKTYAFMAWNADSPPPTPEAQKNAAALVEKFRQGVAEMEVEARRQLKPFNYSPASLQELDRIRQKNPLFDPRQGAYERRMKPQCKQRKSPK